MKAITSGLFVGISEYYERSGFLPLPAADKAALEIHDTFKTAFPSGHWKLLTQSHESRTRRNDFFEFLNEWLNLLKPDQVGVLFICSHGINTPNGLLLAPSDFRENIPFDSGISLKRIIEIIIDVSSNSNKFVLIIDSCRVGDQTQSDNIPDNIVVIYSTKKNRKAFQNSRTSILSSALLGALRSEADTYSDHYEGLQLGTLIERLKLEITKSRCLQEIDIGGSHFKPICFPLLNKNDTKKLGKKDDSPLVQLFSHTESIELIKIKQQTALNTFFDWYNASFNFDSFIFTEKAENQLLKLIIKFPDPGQWRSPSLFLQFLLLKMSRIYEKIVFNWQEDIPVQFFKEITEVYDWTHWIGTTEDGVSLIDWGKNTTRGIIQISTNASNTTRVTITCHSRTDDNISLDNLMPELSLLFDSLYYVHCMSVEI